MQKHTDRQETGLVESVKDGIVSTIEGTGDVAGAMVEAVSRTVAKTIGGVGNIAGSIVGTTVGVLLMSLLSNLLNLLNKDWGWQYFPLFPSVNGLLGYGGIDAATNKERLNLATITSPTFQGTFQRDDLRSRWQAQWGLRVRF